MADIAAFPTIRNVLVQGNNIYPFTAGAAITAGQVVAFHGTGVDNTVHPAVTGTTGAVVGVALYSVGSGEEVAVAMDGCIVYVVNGKDTGDFDAGDYVQAYGTTTPGTVTALVVSGGVAVDYAMVGMMLEDNAAAAAGTYTKCLIKTGPKTPGA